MNIQFASKIATIPRYRALKHIAHAFEKTYGCRSNRKNMLANAEKKRLLKLTKHLQLNSFTNTVAAINIDALKI